MTFDLDVLDPSIMPSTGTPGNYGDLLKNVMDSARSQNSNIKIYISLAGGGFSCKNYHGCF